MPGRCQCMYIRRRTYRLTSSLGRCPDSMADPLPAPSHDPVPTTRLSLAHSPPDMPPGHTSVLPAQCTRSNAIHSDQGTIQIDCHGNAHNMLICLELFPIDPDYFAKQSLRTSQPHKRQLHKDLPVVSAGCTWGVCHEGPVYHSVLPGAARVWVFRRKLCTVFAQKQWEKQYR